MSVILFIVALILSLLALTSLTFTAWDEYWYPYDRQRPDRKN